MSTTEKTKKSAEARKRLDNSIKTIMATKEGRRVMSWVLGFSGLNVSLSVFDSLKMAVLSGRRDVGLDISSRLGAVCPDLVTLMEKESQDE